MPDQQNPNISWEDIFRGVKEDVNPPFKGTFQFKKPTKGQLAVWILIGILILGFLYWWFHPAINIHSDKMWFTIVLFIFIPAFLILKKASQNAAMGTRKHEPSQSRANMLKKVSYVPLVLIGLVLLGTVLSMSIIPGNAEKYASILKTSDYTFAEDIEEVDYSKIPVIDKDSAVLLGNRTLGEIPEYVSQFEISRLYSQINFQGSPVRVSPLLYADFFKWFNNVSTGLPGYVIVDMATQDTKVVRTEQPIMYSESEVLERNIDRYVQLKYPFYMFEEKAFEIDEEGNPYWICPVQTRTIGLFGGEDIERVVLVNACTGETEDYAIADCPQWVDRAYPADLVVQQYNWSGLYLNGWINSVFGQVGVKQTTPGTDGTLGYNFIAKDDDVWLYTGVTSATADDSIIGFVLVNQRTAESHFYSVSGATEASAMRSAEGQVQNLKYTATFPLLLNINNQPTYFISLKDDAGLVKKFAMIDIQRYQNVAVGDTVADCQKSYKALLATNGITSPETVTSDGAGGQTTATGTVRTTTTAVVDGVTHIYIVLEGDNRIYDCVLPGMVDAVRFKAGDAVTIVFDAGEPTNGVTKIS